MQSQATTVEDEQKKNPIAQIAFTEFRQTDPSKNTVFYGKICINHQNICSVEIERTQVVWCSHPWNIYFLLKYKFQPLCYETNFNSVMFRQNWATLTKCQVTQNLSLLFSPFYKKIFLCPPAQWLFGPEKNSFHYWSAPRAQCFVLQLRWRFSTNRS